MLDKLTYLREGKQTSITPEVRAITSTIRGDSRNKIATILSTVSSLKYVGFDEKLFRKRTASQIIKDDFTTGCTDSDIVFVAMSRASGLPAKYVETISNEWLDSGSETSIEGHQYAQVWIKEEKRWIWIDPIGNRIDTLSPNEEGREIYREGLDSWDIGITDFKTLEDSFLKFRQCVNF